MLWALSLTAGSDYGCEKWGSHANNPPLQHSYSMTAHFLPALLLGPSLPPSFPPSSSSLPPSTSLLSFFSCLYSLFLIVFFWVGGGGIGEERAEVCATLAHVGGALCAMLMDVLKSVGVGGWGIRCEITPKVVVLQSRGGPNTRRGCTELRYMTVKC